MIRSLITVGVHGTIRCACCVRDLFGARAQLRGANRIFFSTQRSKRSVSNYQAG